jgi:hypothetical protein
LVKGLNENNFGLIIAFLLPGFILLYGLSYSSNDVGVWLAKFSGKDSATIGGFLYATLASLALGLIVSAARWLIVDHMLAWTGVRDPGLHFENLTHKETLEAFSAAVANHYRFYQYYSNTLIAIAGVFCVYLASHNWSMSWKLWATFVGIVVVLFFGSRDARKKYFTRAGKILGRGA